MSGAAQEQSNDARELCSQFSFFENWMHWILMIFCNHTLSAINVGELDGLVWVFDVLWNETGTYMQVYSLLWCPSKVRPVLGCRFVCRYFGNWQYISLLLFNYTSMSNQQLCWHFFLGFVIPTKWELCSQCVYTMIWSCSTPDLTTGNKAFSELEQNSLPIFLMGI